MNNADLGVLVGSLAQKVSSRNHGIESSEGLAVKQTAVEGSMDGEEIYGTESVALENSQGGEETTQSVTNSTGNKVSVSSSFASPSRTGALKVS